MACSYIPNHPIAVNVYFVDNDNEVNVTNISGQATLARRVHFPILQVNAKRSETAASVLYRVHEFLTNTGVMLFSIGYAPRSIVYNGAHHDFHGLGNKAIGLIVNDPKSSLMVVDGDMVIANCCCLNWCLISCLAKQPHKPTVKVDPDFELVQVQMKR